MKTKKRNSAKTLLLASASKLALTTGFASADSHGGGGGGGGKGDEGPPDELAPQLGLHQVAVPFDAFVPPFNSGDIGPGGSMYEHKLGGYGHAGIIFTGEIPEDGARMDFVISHIRNDQPTDVYLVMGTALAPDDEGDLFPGLNYMGMEPEMRRAEPARDNLENKLDELEAKLEELLENGAPLEEIEKVKEEIEKIERKFLKQPPDQQHGPGWKPRPGKGQKPPPVHSGEICVALDADMEIIAGVRVQPTEPFTFSENFGLGEVVEPHFTSTVVSVQLSKEKIQQFDGQEVFFQAAALPAGEEYTDPLAASQVSECDRYFIAHIVEPKDDDEGMTGGKPDPDAGLGGEDTGDGDNGGKGVE